MNATTRVSLDAIAAATCCGASKPPSPPTGDDTTAPVPPPWRGRVGDLLDQVSGLADAATHLDMDATVNGALARQLLFEAVQLIEEGQTSLGTWSAANCFTGLVVPLQAKIAGARYMPDAHPVLGMVLQPAAILLEEADRITSQAEEEELRPSGEAPSGDAEPQPAVERSAHALETAASTQPIGSWRTAVQGLLDPVQDAMGAAVRLELDDFGNGPFGRDLVYRAQEIIDEHETLLRTGEPDDYYGECIRVVQALITGARYIPDTGAGFGTTLEIARQGLEKIAAILDQADVQPPAPPLPPAADSDPVANFMAGIGLFAELYAEGCRIHYAGSDEADLKAMYRGRGVPQHVFAKPFLHKLMDRPQLLLEGFAAALSHVLTDADDGYLQEFRRLTWDDYAGGPGTRYAAEGDDPDDDGPEGDGLEGEPLHGGDGGGAAPPTPEAGATNSFAATPAAQRAALAKEMLEEVLDHHDHVRTMVSMLGIALTEPAPSLKEIAHVTTVVETLLNDPQHLAQVERLTECLAAMVNACSGDKEGSTAAPACASGTDTDTDDDFPEKPTFTDPASIALDQIVGRLEGWLEATEHIPHADDESSKPHDLMHRLVWGHHYAAMRALYSGAEAEVVCAHLRDVREGLEAVRAELSECDGRWPVVQQCLGMLDELLGSEHGAGGTVSLGEDTANSSESIEALDSPRMHTVAAAGAFISRLVDAFMNHDVLPTAGDLRALHRAASVVMSGVGDEVESDDDLAAHLNRAVGLSSILCMEQLPQHLAEGGTIRAEDVGKRILETLE